MPDSRGQAWSGGRATAFDDPRGTLTAVSFDDLPFVPTRAWVLDRIPRGARRGGHAARTQHRLLVVVAGEAWLTVDDGHSSERVRFTAPQTLHLAPGTWFEIEARSDGLTILALADGSYDRSDYVEDRASLPVAETTPSQTAIA